MYHYKIANTKLYHFNLLAFCAHMTLSWVSNGPEVMDKGGPA